MGPQVNSQQGEQKANLALILSNNRHLMGAAAPKPSLVLTQSQRDQRAAVFTCVEGQQRTDPELFHTHSAQLLSII